MQTVVALKNGGQREFKKVFEEYHHRLYFFLKQMRCYDYVAEEVVQETYIKLFKYIPTLNNNVAFSTQLFQIAKTTYIDYLRKQKMQTIALNDEAMSVPEIQQDGLEKSALLQRLAATIDALPTKCKKAFLLSREEGLSYAEIANTLHISPKTVENQIGKALKILRNKVKHIYVWLYIIFSFYL